MRMKIVCSNYVCIEPIYRMFMCVTTICFCAICKNFIVHWTNITVHEFFKWTFSVSRSHFFSSPFPHHTLSHLFSPFTRCLFFFFLLPFSSSHVTSSFFFFLCRGPSPSPFHFAAAHPLPPSSFPSTATHTFPLFETPMRPPPFADMSILCFFLAFFGLFVLLSSSLSPSIGLRVLQHFAVREREK